MTRGTFVVESFIDELAANAKQDPLAYRVALLDKNPRAKAVLQIAAEKSGWGKPLPAGQGRGIALCTGFGSFIAQVVQVTVDKDGAVNPTHVWCVVDCGIQVNPDTIRAQMESGIVFGLSAALYGEITIKDGRVEQTQLRRLPRAAHQRGAADRRASREERRGARRYRRAGNLVRDAGADQRDLRRQRQAHPQASCCLAAEARPVARELTMIYELRIYRTVLGRCPDCSTAFAVTRSGSGSAWHTSGWLLGHRHR